MDEEMWKRLQKETNGELVLQIPGSAYDKSLKLRVFPPRRPGGSQGIRDCLNSASLLVLPSFSSTVVDASFFGVPVSSLLLDMAEDPMLLI